MTTPKARHIPLLVFLGSLCIQLGWILAVPPFRAIDEFDHAYRAASVAHGHWRPDWTSSAHGRGDLLLVPRDLVDAATPECETYSYTGRDNCRPVDVVGNGMVSVASGAARYSPVYYWVIGTPAKPFMGALSLYVMRIVASLLCSAFLALAMLCLEQWRRTLWPVVGVISALTPVFVYTTMIPAPNGVEMTAGVALWVALLGLAVREGEPGTERRLLLLALPAAFVLSGTRQLGPLWMALILCSVALLLGWHRLWELARRHKVPVCLLGATAASASLANLVWVYTSKSLTLEEHADFPNPLIHSLQAIPLWMFQSIAAFPTRNEQAPVLVYASYLLVGVFAMLLGVKLGTQRLRLALFATASLSIAVPWLMTYATYTQAGAIWQGRYGLGYSVGVLLLAALALDQADFRHRLQWPVLAGIGLAVASAQCISVLSVYLRERAGSPLSGDPRWITAPSWALTLIVAAGMVAWGIAVRASRNAPEGQDFGWDASQGASNSARMTASSGDLPSSTT